jgi:hypothetical protein
MTSNRLIPIVLVALGLALIGAGCGSDGSKSQTHLSKAEFVRKGNAICAAGNKEINTQGKKLFGGSQKQPSKPQMKRFANDVLIPSVQKEIDQLRKLGPPAGDESKVKSILDAAQQGLDKGKQDPLSLTQNNAGPFKKANAMARQYGLKVCGS